MHAYTYTHVLTHFIQSAGGFVEMSVRRRLRWWRSQTGPVFGCRVGGGGGGIRPLALAPGGLPLHPVGQEEVVTRGLVALPKGRWHQYQYQYLHPAGQRRRWTVVPAPVQVPAFGRSGEVTLGDSASTSTSTRIRPAAQRSTSTSASIRPAAQR